MNIEIEKRTACQLQLQVYVPYDHSRTEHISPSYSCGPIFFELKVNSSRGPNDGTCFVATARYVKAVANDNLLYNCSVKINYNHVNGYKKVNFTDKDNWCLLLNERPRTSPTISFHVDVHFELAISVTPYASLYEDTELSDLTLNAEDGSVSVHAPIIAAVSPVLKKMLTGNWQEALNKSVTIPDVTKDTLEHFKKYMYLGQLPENTSELEKLVVIGSCYLIPDLVQKSTVKILFQLTGENVTHFQKFAVQYKLDFLLEAIIQTVYNQSIDGVGKFSWDGVLKALGSDDKNDVPKVNA